MGICLSPFPWLPYSLEWLRSYSNVSGCCWMGAFLKAQWGHAWLVYAPTAFGPFLLIALGNIGAMPGGAAANYNNKMKPCIRMRKWEPWRILVSMTLLSHSTSLNCLLLYLLHKTNSLLINYQLLLVVKHNPYWYILSQEPLKVDVLKLILSVRT